MYILKNIKKVDLSEVHEDGFFHHPATYRDLVGARDDDENKQNISVIETYIKYKDLLTKKNEQAYEEQKAEVKEFIESRLSMGAWPPANVKETEKIRASLTKLRDYLSVSEGDARPQAEEVSSAFDCLISSVKKRLHCVTYFAQKFTNNHCGGAGVIPSGFYCVDIDELKVGSRTMLDFLCKIFGKNMYSAHKSKYVEDLRLDEVHTSARGNGMHIIIDIAPALYRKLYRPGDVADRREIRYICENLNKALDTVFEEAKAAGEVTVEKWGKLDKLFDATRRIFVPPTSYDLYVSVEYTQDPFIQDHEAKILSVLTDELHLRFEGEPQRGRRPVSHVFPAAADPDVQVRESGGRDPFASVTCDYMIDGQPARDVCRAFFEREGYDLSKEGNRHEGLTKWLGSVKHYFLGEGESVDLRDFLPRPLGPEMGEEEISGIIKEAEKPETPKLPEGSSRLNRAAMRAEYEQKLREMPRIPFAAIPEWLKPFLERVKNDDIMSRMILTRVWPVLCSRMGGYVIPGRNGGDMFPCINSMVLGPSSCGKDTTRFVNDIILHDITIRDMGRMKEMRENAAARDAAGNGKKERKKHLFIHTLQDMTVAAVRNNLLVSGGERMLIPLDEVEQTNFKGADLDTFFSFLKRSDGDNDEAVLRSADTAVSGIYKLTLNFSITGNTQAAYRIFRRSIADGNSGELGRLLLFVVPELYDYEITPQLGPLPDAEAMSTFFREKLDAASHRQEANPQIVKDFAAFEREVRREVNLYPSMSLRSVVARTLNAGYLIAHICAILSGGYGEGESELAKFVVASSLHSFRESFCPKIDDVIRQNNKKSQRVGEWMIRDLPEGTEFTARDLADRYNTDEKKIQKNLSWWTKKDKITRVSKGVYKKGGADAQHQS